MAAVTKNRNFFNCPFLLYYKSDKFALNWISGFRGKDLNVFFYQNRSNLKQIWLGWSFGWSPFNIESDSPALQSKWLLLLKIEISLVVNFCFIANHNELKV
jgi:hypothetical protein